MPTPTSGYIFLTLDIGTLDIYYYISNYLKDILLLQQQIQAMAAFWQHSGDDVKKYMC